MSACNPIINYSFAEGSHYTHCNCNGAKLKKDMSKSTFKILFYLRKNYLNKEGKAGIMIRLSLNGEISQFSSKLDIEPDKWDTTLGKAKGNTQKARQLNETLEDIRASLKNHYRDIEVHESFVTVEKIRNAFLGITAKQRTLEKPRDFDPFGQTGFAHLWLQYDCPFKVLVLGVNFILPF